MNLWQYGFWGLVGGMLVDGVEFYAVVRANKGVVPEAWKRPGWLVAEIIRIGCGGLLAVGFAESGQVSGPVGAMALGAAAPLIIEKLSQQLPPAREN